MSKMFSVHRNGFTLVELLTVLVILIVVFAIISLLLYLPMRSSQFTQFHYTTFEEMRRVLEVMRRELTLAKDAEATDTSIDQINLSGRIAFFYKDGAFFIKTSTGQVKLADVNLSLDEPLFKVATSNSNPPKPKKYVEVRLVHSNPPIKLKTSIGLLNSSQLNPSQSNVPATGNVLLAKKE